MTATLSEIELLALKKSPLTCDELERVRRLSKLQSSMSDELIERFYQNIEAFREFIPDIANTFAHYQPKTTLDFFCTENGIPNLQFPDRNKDILYKCDDPKALCDAQVAKALEDHVFTGTIYKKEQDNYGQIHFRYLAEAITKVNKATEDEKLYSAKELASIPNAVIVGLGLGYILESLCSRAELINIVIIEPDLDMFYASLHAFDWSSFLKYLRENNFGINFLLGQTPEQLSLDLTSYYEHHGRFLSAQCLCLVHYASDEIRNLVNTLNQDYYRLHAAMGFYDDHLFGTSHGLYAATHHHKFLRSDVALLPQYCDLPVFIIGNGPSLDKDIAFLRQNQDKALIIACGTALDTLYHAGIKPDFYAATERTPEIAETLDAIPDKDFIRSLTLLAGDVIHPYTQDRFEHTAIFGKPDEPFYWRILSRLPIGAKIRVVNVMNPIVGNLGISAALSLGFENIYLFGIDNGKRMNTTRMHSKFSASYSTYGLKDNTGNYDLSQGITLAGNFGGEVQANYIFRLANRHMELVINRAKESSQQNIKIYNCSDGAKITGTSALHSNEIDTSNFKVIAKDEIMAYIHNFMSMDLALSPTVAKALCDTHEFDEVCAQILEVFNQSFDSRTALVKAMERSSEKLWRIYEVPKSRSLAYDLEGTMQSMFIMALNALYHIKNEDKAVSVALDVIKSFNYFIEDAKLLFRHLPDYIMGEHHQFLKGKLGFDHEDSPAPETSMRGKLFKDPPLDPLKKFIKLYA